MTSIESGETERFSYHSLNLWGLPPVLPLGQQLVLDHSTGYSLVIDWERKEDQIRSATTFTEEELSVVSTLASNWPSFVACETLMSNKIGEGPTTSQIDDARATGYLDTLTTPLRDLIEVCRTKLQVLRLDISEIDQYGYRLVMLNKAEERSH